MQFGGNGQSVGRGIDADIEGMLDRPEPRQLFSRHNGLPVLSVVGGALSGAA
jgi:hypothetical protein